MNCPLSLSLCAGAYEYKTLHVGRRPRRRWRWFESLVTRLAVLIMIFGQSKEEKDSANENNEQERGKQRSHARPVGDGKESGGSVIHTRITRLS